MVFARSLTSKIIIINDKCNGTSEGDHISHVILTSVQRLLTHPVLSRHYATAVAHAQTDQQVVEMLFNVVRTASLCCVLNGPCQICLKLTISLVRFKKFKIRIKR